MFLLHLYLLPCALLPSPCSYLPPTPFFLPTLTSLPLSLPSLSLLLLAIPSSLPSQQELRSFKVTLSVDPKYHPNIIGRKGATINKIRDDHDVRIQLPDKDGPNADEIMIMGYEHQVKAAQEDILKIVHDLVRDDGVM